MAISTFVAVPTLAVGDKLTATRWNTIVTALNFLLAPPEAVATNGAGTSVANNTLTLVPFATEDVDTGPSYDGAMHDTVTNNSRVAATTAGRYDYETFTAWPANGTGRRLSHIRKNSGGSSAGGTFMREVEIPSTPSASANQQVFVRSTATFAANDYLELFVLQSSGGALSLQTAQTTWLRMRLVGQ